MAQRGAVVVDDIARKISSSDGTAHADETNWTVDGERAYFWGHGIDEFIHVQFDTARAGEVSHDILDTHCTGTLVTDCYSGYAVHDSDNKQTCLAHLARTGRDGTTQF